MRNWRFFALTVLALITWSGVAAGAPLEHYEGLTAYGDRVYALVSIADNNPDFTQDYHPSKVVEFNAALVKQRELVLQDGTDAAMNSTSLVLHNGKLYVGSVGGMMPNNEGGDVWEVDPGNWTARKLLSVKDATGNPWGVSGLEIASDGRVFILAGGYDASWNFVARLYITTVTALSAGTIGSETTISSAGGYSWGIAWSEFDQTLWVMAGTELQARSINGAIRETFTPSQLGDDIYSISPLEGGGLFYAVSNYFNGSAGLITKAGSAYTARPNLVTNLGGDATVFAFKNNNGDTGLLLREYNYGANDIVYVYDAQGNFSAPIVNVSNWGTNIISVTTLGNSLYFGTYESYASGNPDQLSGEIGRVDMSAWWQGEPPPAPVKSSGGGGCDSGFGAAVLLLTIPAALIKNRKR